MKKYCQGFIDIISLIAVVFLVATITTVTFVTNKEGANFDLRNKASTNNYQMCGDVPIDQCASISGCSVKSNSSTTSAPCSDSDCSNSVAGCSLKTVTAQEGHCSCTLEGSTAKTQADCKSSDFLGECRWVAPVVSQICTGTKTTTNTSQSCEGTINTCDRCSLGASKGCTVNGKEGTQTCVNSEDCVGQVNSGNWGGCVEKAAVIIPPPTPTTTSGPNSCGASGEACCGDNPGKCNTGLYCSNIDNGTCMTAICHAERKCSGDVLQICKTDDSGWNNTTCQYGCSSVSLDCKTCNTGDKVCEGDSLKTCNSTQTGWDTQACGTNRTCDNNLKTCVNTSGTCMDPCQSDSDCGTGNYCYQPSGGCPVCKAKGLSCTPGEKRCSSNFAQTCNTQGTSWQSLDCLTFGCNLDTKECNPDPTIISQNDCDKCLLTNSPSECQGACSNIGEKIVVDSCTPNKNECFFGNLRTCSSSGTKGLTTCSNGCDEVNNVCKPAITKRCGAGNLSVETYENNEWSSQMCATGYCDSTTFVCVDSNQAFLDNTSAQTEDPLIRASLIQEIENCVISGFTQTQCDTAYQTGIKTNDTCITFYLLKNPIREVSEIKTQCDEERVNTIMFAAGMASLGGTNLITSPIVQGLNKIDDITVAASCLSGNLMSCIFTASQAANPLLTLKNLTQQKIGLLRTNLALSNSQNLYEFYRQNPWDTFQGYIDRYGKVPQSLQLIRDPAKLYPFQQMAIDIANNPTSEGIGEMLTNIASQKNVKLSVLTGDEMSNMFGEGVGGVCRTSECGGILGIGKTRIAEVFVMDPKDYASLYNNEGFEVTQAESIQLTIQKVCHEAGHACDWTQMGLQNSWATEFRQKAFNVLFYQEIGQTSLARDYQKFLDYITAQSNVVYIQGK